MSRARHVHVVSTGPASGKSTITTGLIRLLRDRGLNVVPFKPVSESTDPEGLPTSESLQHQCFAAGLDPSPVLAPVVVVPRQRECEVYVQGASVGSVPLVARDTPMLDALGGSGWDAVTAAVSVALDEVLGRAEIVVSEGAGGALDLTSLGRLDLPNTVVGDRADAVVVIARVRRGGALAALEPVLGTLLAAAPDRPTGFVLNDTAGPHEVYRAAGQRVARQTGTIFGGTMPWSDFFDGRPSHSPPSQECAEDHAHLAGLVADNLDLELFLPNGASADTPW